MHSHRIARTSATDRSCSPPPCHGREREGGGRPGPVPSVDVASAGAGAGDGPGIARRSQSVQFAFPTRLVRDKFTLDVAGKSLLCSLAGGEDRLVLRSVPLVVFWRRVVKYATTVHLALISRSRAAVSSSESAVVGAGCEELAALRDLGCQCWVAYDATAWPLVTAAARAVGAPPS